MCLGQWYRVELVPAKGWRIPATPLYVSSYLFLLPVYDAPSSAERKERIGEEERGGRERGRDRSEWEERRWGGGRRFVNIHYVCAEKGEAGGKREKWKRNETMGIHVWKACARHARIYSHEDACKREPTKKKTGKKKLCRRTNVAGRLN